MHLHMLMHMQTYLVCIQTYHLSHTHTLSLSLSLSLSISLSLSPLSGYSFGNTRCTLKGKIR